MTKLGEELENERVEMIKEIKKQPGVAEFMEVYGNYEEFLAKAQAYIGLLYTQQSYSVSNNTS